MNKTKSTKANYSSTSPSKKATRRVSPSKDTSSKKQTKVDFSISTVASSPLTIDEELLADQIVSEFTTDEA